MNLFGPRLDGHHQVHTLGDKGELLTLLLPCPQLVVVVVVVVAARGCVGC